MPRLAQPFGSTSIEVNKQSIARNFGVKQSEVIYFSVGAVLTGYKVIYDKAEQRAYTLPTGIAAGVTAISLSTAGVLVHSKGTVDLGQLAASRREFVTVPGIFTDGHTINTHNEQLIHQGSLYHWEGTLPKVINVGDTPETSGGIGTNAWVLDFESAYKALLASREGGNNVGTLIGTKKRTVTDKLSDIVCVLDFGADPTGATECSAAFQAACDTGKTVLVPIGIYWIGQSIVLKRSVTIVGEGNSGQINRAMSFINMEGNIPFITNWTTTGNPNSMFQYHIKRLFVQYNPATRPEEFATNSSKIAFYFQSPVVEANGTEFSSIEDVVVLGAWAAYQDKTGTYMSALKRVEARNCRYGFLKATGTTITLENCYCNGTLTAYQFGAMSTVKMINCAMDNTSVTLAGGSLGGAGLHMISVRCFDIDSFDAEVNVIDTNGGGIASLIHIEDSVGTIRNVVGLHNTLKTSGPTVGGSVAKYRITRGSLVKFIGCEDEFFRGEQSEYIGSGYAITMLSDETSKTNVELSRMRAPKAATGNTPTLLMLSQGYVTWTDCDSSGLIGEGGTVVSTKGGAITAPAFKTGSGKTVVAANVPSTIITLPSKGAYLVFAMVEGSGKEYSATSQFTWDGTASTAKFNLIDGAFIELAGAGNEVTVTCAGTTTVTWSYIKLL